MELLFLLHLVLQHLMYNLTHLHLLHKSLHNQKYYLENLLLLLLLLLVLLVLLHPQQKLHPLQLLEILLEKV
jgi:hypothetical protein